MNEKSSFSREDFLCTIAQMSAEGLILLKKCATMVKLTRLESSAFSA